MKAGTYEQVALPSKYKHYLSNVDAANKTADCSNCGPNVKIGYNGTDKFGTRWACSIRVREGTRHKRTYQFGDGEILTGPEVVEARLKLFEEQNGCCAICKEPESRDRELALDHCHDTGEIRGLLCSACNTGIGLFKDSPERLVAASEYLTR
jgi:hypothetical protein